MSHPIPTQDITEKMYPEDPDPEDTKLSFSEAVREVFVDNFDEAFDDLKLEQQEHLSRSLNSL